MHKISLPLSFSFLLSFSFYFSSLSLSISLSLPLPLPLYRIPKKRAYPTFAKAHYKKLRLLARRDQSIRPRLEIGLYISNNDDNANDDNEKEKKQHNQTNLSYYYGMRSDTIRYDTNHTIVIAVRVKVLARQGSVNYRIKYMTERNNRFSQSRKQHVQAKPHLYVLCLCCILLPYTLLYLYTLPHLTLPYLQPSTHTHRKSYIPSPLFLVVVVGIQTSALDLGKEGEKLNWLIDK